MWTKQKNAIPNTHTSAHTSGTCSQKWETYPAQRNGISISTTCMILCTSSTNNHDHHFITAATDSPCLNLLGLLRGWLLLLHWGWRCDLHHRLRGLWPHPLLQFQHAHRAAAAGRWQRYVAVLWRRLQEVTLAILGEHEGWQSTVNIQLVGLFTHLLSR